MTHLLHWFAAWLGGENSSASKPQPAAVRLVAALQLLAVTYGRAPYVKPSNHLLTCKHDASASLVCRMAELL